MAILSSVALQSYRNLKNLYNSINNDNIENYIDYLYKINIDLKNVKKYLATYSTPTMIREYPMFEAMYEEICYYASLKEEATLRNANDQCNRVEFNK